MKNGGWVEVRRKKGHDRIGKCSVWTASRGKGVGDSKAISSFFFTEFLKDFGAKEMTEVFKDYGIMREVFIPVRRDKRGKHYGFDGFRMIVDYRIMAMLVFNTKIPVETLGM
ncbi:unnamed protein product [Lathyrus sativus]|nr:unnamed protein product [Lathyrus sativus]